MEKHQIIIEINEEGAEIISGELASRKEYIILVRKMAKQSNEKFNLPRE